MMRLILYSKPGCHLCEGLQEKLAAITSIQFDLEVRDITRNTDWFERYQYEVPVLMQALPDSNTESLIPRPSPRLSVMQLERHLQKTLQS